MYSTRIYKGESNPFDSSAKPIVICYRPHHFVGNVSRNRLATAIRPIYNRTCRLPKPAFNDYSSTTFTNVASFNGPITDQHFHASNTINATNLLQGTDTISTYNQNNPIQTQSSVAIIDLTQSTRKSETFEMNRIEQLKRRFVELEARPKFNADIKTDNDSLSTSSPSPSPSEAVDPRCFSFKTILTPTYVKEWVDKNWEFVLQCLNSNLVNI